MASVVALGRALAVDIAAEGVEKSEQVMLLKAAGCSTVQGFLFGATRRPASERDDAAAAETAGRTAAQG